MIGQDFEDLEQFFNKSSDQNILQFLAKLHFADIAEIISQLSVAAAVRVLELLAANDAADVLSEVDLHQRQSIVEMISEEKLITLLAEMESDDAADIIEELPSGEAEEILDSIDPEESEEVRKLLQYSPESAGGLMQTELVSLPGESSIQEAIRAIREQTNDVSNIHYVYVVNQDHVLKGIISLEQLIINQDEARLADVMDTQLITVPAQMDQEEVAQLFQKYDLVTLPVLDAEGLLLGRILIDDVVDVIAEEASEDIYRLAGVATDEHSSDSAFRTSKLRVPWLFIYVLTALISTAIIISFDETIRQVVWLAAFMPIVAGLGGNAGTQSLTVITRAIALGEIDFKDAKTVLVKELLSSLLSGAVIGLVTFLGVWLILSQFWLGLVIAIAMLLNVFMAALMGTAVPLILKRLNIDPALASGVFVASFTDAMGFFAVLGLASLFLHRF